MVEKLQIFSLVREGWELFKKNWRLALAVSIVLIVIQGLFSNFGYSIDSQGVESGSWLVSLVGYIVSIILGIGSIQIFLSLSRGGQTGIKELFTSVTWDRLFSYVVASIIYGILVTIGFFLLIIPGFIVMAVLMPYVYLVVDKNLGPIDSLRKAREITKGNRWQVFGLVVVLGILNLVGLLALVVGLLVTLPVSMFAMVEMYRQLMGETGAVIQESVLDEEGTTEGEEVKEMDTPQ